MKIYIGSIVLFLALIISPALKAQVHEVQSDDTDTAHYKTLIPEAKQGLLKNMSMIANMRFAERNEYQGGDYTQSTFNMEQFRLEIKGDVTDRVYFRFRDRYTRAQEPQSIDGISRSTDLAFIRVKATDKLSISVGKMCADWGAYEFDYNPIDIYEYSDIIEYADNFLSGVGASYQANKNHQFTIQVLDSRTSTFTELYGAQPHYIESKAPMAFVANWRGSFANGKFNTIWSYARHNEAQNTLTNKAAAMDYIALGNQLKMGKFTVEYDFKWSAEDLDRTHIISDEVPDQLYPYAVEKTLYIGHWLHAYYRVSPKVNLAVVGMVDIAKWRDETIPGKTTDDFRTAYGIIPTFEYYPFSDVNLRFFVNWVGRIYKYSDEAKNIPGGPVNSDNGRISLGFVSPLGIF